MLTPTPAIRTLQVERPLTAAVLLEGFRSALLVPVMKGTIAGIPNLMPLTLASITIPAALMCLVVRVGAGVVFTVSVSVSFVFMMSVSVLPTPSATLTAAFPHLLWVAFVTTG